MDFVLATLWHERRRYLPGVLAVAFSALLIGLQVGIFWGLISVVSVPIVRSRADLWIGYPRTASIDLGRPIPAYYRDRVEGLPEILRTDQYLQAMCLWKNTREEVELALVAGCSLDDDTLGPAGMLPAELRAALREPMTVVFDRGDMHRLGVAAAGELGSINNRPVRVAGFMTGMGSLTGPYALCSLETARVLIGLREDQTTYLLAALRDPRLADDVAQRLNEFPNFRAHVAERFALESKIHWLTKTKAGVAVTFVAALGLFVGAVVTSQTLYAATTAAQRELAVLRALGIPAGTMRRFVLRQAACVGVLGIALGIPGAYLLGAVASHVGTNADLAPWIVGLDAALTLLMSVVAGLYAMRSLSAAEPTALLR
jgi:putative ABC transport system permease protein